MKLDNTILASLFWATFAAGSPAPQATGSPSLIRFFLTGPAPLNGAYISSNGTHLGVRGDGSSAFAVQAFASPGPQTNTNLLHVPSNGNVLGLVGPPGNLAFVELSDPPPPPPPGNIVEWQAWRLFPAPDPRVRMADMTASIWIAQPDGEGGWGLVWFKGNIGPGMTMVTLFWEPVP